MAIQPNDADFVEMINKATRDYIAKIVSEEAEAAADRVRERVAAGADAFALSVLQYYEIEKDLDRMVITVKKNI